LQVDVGEANWSVVLSRGEMDFWNQLLGGNVCPSVRRFEDTEPRPFDMLLERCGRQEAGGAGGLIRMEAGAGSLFDQ
jgi:hypothetical protein